MASFVKFLANIRRRYDIESTFIWSHNIISASCRRHVFTVITVITCTTAILTILLSVREVTIFNQSSIFSQYSIIFVAVTPYSFIFRSREGTQFVILFRFCVKIIAHSLYIFTITDCNGVKCKGKNKKFF